MRVGRVGAKSLSLPNKKLRFQTLTEVVLKPKGKHTKRRHNTKGARGKAVFHL